MSEPFFHYRLPGSKDIVSGKECRCVKGLARGGFSFAPFLDGGDIYTLLPDTLTITPIDDIERIHASGLQTEGFRKGKSGSLGRNGYQDSPMTDSYRESIEAIKGILRENGGGKIVFARILETGPIESLNNESVFRNLCQAYPQAFTFWFRSPQWGEWLGASPELLLASEDGGLKTMSLAGTRPVGTPDEWDKKNLEEQRLVTDFILGIFHEFGLNPSEGPLQVRNAGPVEHLMTPISSADGISENQLTRFLQALSPTPALCGSDRPLALKSLARLEAFDRELYGGWCGPYHLGSSGFRFNVILRCLKLTARNCRLYCGGGITTKSDPQTEWEETRRKASTLLPFLQPDRQ